MKPENMPKAGFGKAPGTRRMLLTERAGLVAKYTLLAEARKLVLASPYEPLGA